MPSNNHMLLHAITVLFNVQPNSALKQVKNPNPKNLVNALLFIYLGVPGVSEQLTSTPELHADLSQTDVYGPLGRPSLLLKHLDQ